MGIATSIADGIAGAGDSLGLDFRGAIEESDNPVEAGGRWATGTYGFIGGIEADLAGDEAASRESWVARGIQRDIIDTFVDYDGEWGGTGDSADLIGTGLYGSEGSLFDTVHSTPGEQPSVEETKTKLGIVAVVLLVVAFIAAPYAEIVAGVFGGDE